MAEQLVRIPPSAVVAAVDGSDIALAAAHVAAGEAELRQQPLVLMYCFTWPAIYPPLTALFPPDPGPRKRAESILSAAADEIRSAHPAVDTQVLLRNGPPAAMLIEESPRASLLVLGHRGSGGFAGLHIGSVAIHTAAHARCPVLVVRGDPPAPDTPVLVGVDGSEESKRALQFAFPTAARRHVALRVVAVWPSIWTLPLAVEETARHEAEQRLAGQLGSLPAQYPAVKYETRVVPGDSAAGTLITEASGAGLVVVGSRGRGGLRGILLGSVGRALLAHSPCPVVVCRAG
jgi:nucleotide-binding universal stress UspA family protein